MLVIWSTRIDRLVCCRTVHPDRSSGIMVGQSTYIDVSLLVDVSLFSLNG